MQCGVLGRTRNEVSTFDFKGNGDAKDAPDSLRDACSSLSVPGRIASALRLESSWQGFHDMT